MPSLSEAQLESLATKDERLVVTINNLADTLESHCETQFEQIRDQHHNIKENMNQFIEVIKNLMDTVRVMGERVDEQNKTIKGLITGKVTITDTRDVQEKLKEVIQEELKDLKDTVVAHGENNATLTQTVNTTVNSTAKLGGQILIQVTKGKGQETGDEAKKDCPDPNVNNAARKLAQSSTATIANTFFDEPRV